jgi:aspartate kinase
MRILVQKFGGTSVRTAEARAMAIDKVIAAKKSGYTPVVVVSAMGRAGEPYATDTLIKFAREAAGCELNPRDNDLLMSCGETISAVVIAGAFEERGYSARAVTGWQAGIYTNDRFGNASYFEVDTARLYEMLNSGLIPVVTGFQGITRNGDVTTLGRGGSDTTAAILGSALRAEAIEIYTDVDGIMTADPRLLPEARVLSDVSYSEVFQMADHGAKVIHPKAVEIAMRGNVPLIVRNTMSDAAGTRISSEVMDLEANAQDVLSSIAYIGGRAQLKAVQTTATAEKTLLCSLADAGISIDLINVFPESVVFTIDEDKTDKAQAILNEQEFEFTLITGLGKVSAVGSRMRGVPGVMARIIRALSDEGVTVLQTSDSHMTISCLIKAEDAQRAVRAMHEEFRLSKNKQ